MPRGGPRSGAGAPKGNMNALKTGAYSPRVKAVIQAIMGDPEARSVMLQLGRKGHLARQQTRRMSMAVARLMHDRPVAEEARRQLDALVDQHLGTRQTDAMRTAIANYEQTIRRDALTDQPLAGRPPSRTPAQLARREALRARLAALLEQRRRDSDPATHPAFADPDDDAPFIPILDALAARPDPELERQPEQATDPMHCHAERSEASRPPATSPTPHSLTPRELAAITAGEDDDPPVISVLEELRHREDATDGLEQDAP